VGRKLNLLLVPKQTMKQPQ